MPDNDLKSLIMYRVSMVARIGPKEPHQRPYLREWREHRGLTQQQLADRMGKSKASISRYETGARGIPGGYLAAVAEALRCTVPDLYRLPDAPRSLDDLLASASEETRRQARAIVEALLKTGT